MKVILSLLFFSSFSFFCLPVSASGKSFESNIIVCPQHISGIFTLYGSHDFIQNGLKWNYGPYNSNTPAVIQFHDAHTTNQISGMTPGLVIGPAVICAGKINGAHYVFMTNPSRICKQDYPNFHVYPVGTIGWAIAN